MTFFELPCLWIPITKVVPAKKIGLPDEPNSVLAEWLNSNENGLISIIFPIELFKFPPPGNWDINIFLLGN